MIKTIEKHGVKFERWATSPSKSGIIKSVDKFWFDTHELELIDEKKRLYKIIRPSTMKDLSEWVVLECVEGWYFGRIINI